MKAIIIFALLCLTYSITINRFEPNFAHINLADQLSFSVSFDDQIFPEQYLRVVFQNPLGNINNCWLNEINNNFYFQIQNSSCMVTQTDISVYFIAFKSVAKNLSFTIQLANPITTQVNGPIVIGKVNSLADFTIEIERGVIEYWVLLEQIQVTGTAFWVIQQSQNGITFSITPGIFASQYKIVITQSNSDYSFGNDCNVTSLDWLQMICYVNRPQNLILTIEGNILNTTVINVTSLFNQPQYSSKPNIISVLILRRYSNEVLYYGTTTIQSQPLTPVVPQIQNLPQVQPSSTVSPINLIEIYPSLYLGYLDQVLNFSFTSTFAIPSNALITIQTNYPTPIAAGLALTIDTTQGCQFLMNSSSIATCQFYSITSNTISIQLTNSQLLYANSSIWAAGGYQYSTQPLLISFYDQNSNLISQTDKSVIFYKLLDPKLLEILETNFTVSPLGIEASLFVRFYVSDYQLAKQDDIVIFTTNIIEIYNRNNYELRCAIYDGSNISYSWESCQLSSSSISIKRNTNPTNTNYYFLVLYGLQVPQFETYITCQIIDKNGVEMYLAPRYTIPVEQNNNLPGSNYVYVEKKISYIGESPEFVFTLRFQNQLTPQSSLFIIYPRAYLRSLISLNVPTCYLLGIQQDPLHVFCQYNSELNISQSRNSFVPPLERIILHVYNLPLSIRSQYVFQLMVKLGPFQIDTDQSQFIIASQFVPKTIFDTLTYANDIATSTISSGYLKIINFSIQSIFWLIPHKIQFNFISNVDIQGILSITFDDRYINKDRIYESPLCWVNLLSRVCNLDGQTIIIQIPKILSGTNTSIYLQNIPPPDVLEYIIKPIQLEVYYQDQPLSQSSPYIVNVQPISYSKDNYIGQGTPLNINQKRLTSTQLELQIISTIDLTIYYAISLKGDIKNIPEQNFNSNFHLYSLVKDITPQSNYNSLVDFINLNQTIYKNSYMIKLQAQYGVFKYSTTGNDTLLISQLNAGQAYTVTLWGENTQLQTIQAIQLNITTPSQNDSIWKVIVNTDPSLNDYQINDVLSAIGRGFNYSQDLVYTILGYTNKSYFPIQRKIFYLTPYQWDQQPFPNNDISSQVSYWSNRSQNIVGNITYYLNQSQGLSLFNIDSIEQVDQYPPEFVSVGNIVPQSTSIKISNISLAHNGYVWAMAQRLNISIKGRIRYIQNPTINSMKFNDSTLVDFALYNGTPLTLTFTKLLPESYYRVSLICTSEDPTDNQQVGAFSFLETTTLPLSGFNLFLGVLLLIFIY